LKIDFFDRSVISPFAVKLFLLPFSSHCSTQNIGFSDSGYVIKPPQPSSAIYGAPPFTGHLCSTGILLAQSHAKSSCKATIWFTVV